MEQRMPHSLTLSDRQRLKVTGVEEVLRFEEEGALLRTALGDLQVQGRELKLKTLSPQGGELEILGEIGALFYEQSREGLWRRLLG